MAYLSSRYTKKYFSKGFFMYLFLAVMVVIIIVAIPTREDFIRGSGQNNGQTETNNNNKSLGKKDPAQYEEENYHEWTNPAEF